MMWFVYDEGHFVGTVIAFDKEDAFLKASEKFGATWVVREVKTRNT